jgi:hypothetical protein
MTTTQRSWKRKVAPACALKTEIADSLEPPPAHAASLTQQGHPERSYSPKATNDEGRSHRRSTRIRVATEQLAIEPPILT